MKLTKPEIMELWRRHGGGVYGPHVETVSMPQEHFWDFIAEIQRRAALNPTGRS